VVPELPYVRRPMPDKTAALLRRAHTASVDAAAQVRRRRRTGATTPYHPAISYADTLMYRLDEAGWAFSEIGEACGLNRRAVYQRCRRARERGLHPGPFPPLPDPPTPRVVHFAKPPVPHVPADVAAELCALRAATKPGVTTAGHPAMVARRELSRRLHALHTQGVPVRRLAEAIGVVPSCVSHRMTQDGYVLPGGPRRGPRRPVPPAVARRARQLRAAGVANRHWLPDDHPARAASLALDALLAGLVVAGYLPDDIGHSTGMDGNTVRMRVTRYHNRPAPRPGDLTAGMIRAVGCDPRTPGPDGATRPVTTTATTGDKTGDPP
jgi:hypothetical protein